MNWIDANLFKPSDDSDCLVIFKIDSEQDRFVRAPVWWSEPSNRWCDEWNNEFEPESVLYFSVITLP